MHVLIIHNHYAQYGGEDKVLEHQVQLLRSKGHKVSLFSKHNDNIKDFSLIDKIKLFKSGYSNAYIENELEDIIRNEKPDIAHVHNIYPIISPLVYKVLHENNIPIVQTLHNYRFICPNGLMYNNNKICRKCLDTNNLYNCFYDKCYRNNYLESFWYADIISQAYKKGYFEKVDKFIALNPFMKNIMISKGFPENKLSVIPNFVDEKEIESVKKKDYFLFIGRLSEEKGVIQLVKSMEHLINIELKIVGEGPLESEIKNYIKERNLENITLVGFKKGYEKNLLISESKGLIVPSQWYENFPTVVLEALSLGTLVIGSDIGGLSYMIDNGLNGLLFKPENLLDLAEKIKLIAEDDNLMQSLSSNAFRTYKRNYTPNSFYMNIMHLYKEILTSKTTKVGV
ncbi:glycosyltransferase family 4 protein [Bacillus sp. FJAT-27245]|uniref:glycosyltransferase family 4 protein n=1 Tax=Bacillus sp. FJAT-27245 TaxID=1684144 RepID=UPI0006A77EC9|nr:glycosyltransferase family 4 protein [Bacillus sp. FJAT-27245]